MILFRATPPAVPVDLLEQFGEPEAMFGPNMRFRISSAIIGIFLVILGFAFVVGGPVILQGNVMAGVGVYVLLGCGLMLMGVTAIVVPIRLPLNWVFVCPSGLIRSRGEIWEAVDWADVVRFEDASMSGSAVTIQQCRIVRADGSEWGFLADHIAYYGRLAEVLRQRVAEGDGEKIEE